MLLRITAMLSRRYQYISRKQKGGRLKATRQAMREELVGRERREISNKKLIESKKSS